MVDQIPSYPDDVVDRCHRCGYLMVEFYSPRIRGLQGLTCSNSECDVSDLLKDPIIQQPVKFFIRAEILQN